MDNPWSHTLATPSVTHTLTLDNLYISATGTFHQGNHIFDPRIGKNRNVSTYDCLWVAANNGAYADALSTGLFLLSEAEIERIVNQDPHIAWVVFSKNGKLNSFPEDILISKEQNPS